MSSAEVWQMNCPSRIRHFLSFWGIPQSLMNLESLIRSSSARWIVVQGSTLGDTTEPDELGEFDQVVQCKMDRCPRLNAIEFEILDSIEIDDIERNMWRKVSLGSNFLRHGRIFKMFELCQLIMLTGFRDLAELGMFLRSINMPNSLDMESTKMAQRRSVKRANIFPLVPKKFTHQKHLTTHQRSISKTISPHTTDPFKMTKK